MDTCENKCIEDRLIWYQKAFPQEKEEEPNMFDSVQFLYDMLELLQDSNTNLYVCERKNSCKCKYECLCDSDTYYSIRDMTMDIASNHCCIFQFYSSEKLKLSKKTNLRFFTLNNLTDEELPLIDIIYVFGKKKKLENLYVKFLGIEDNITFDIFDTIKLSENEIQFNFDYLGY